MLEEHAFDIVSLCMFRTAIQLSSLESLISDLGGLFSSQIFSVEAQRSELECEDEGAERRASFVLSSGLAWR